MSEPSSRGRRAALAAPSTSIVTLTVALGGRVLDLFDRAPGDDHDRPVGLT
jgi:hypothetical protein